MSADNEGRRPLNAVTPRAAVGTKGVSVAGHGLARSPSLRQTRPTRKPLNRSNTPVVPQIEQDNEQEARTANAELIIELKEQVERAEQASEQYRKQLEVLQQRLDEFTEEQTAAEEREYQRRSDLDLLRVEMKEAGRHTREIEQSHESERSLLLQERQHSASREAELQAVIQRLTETLRTRESRRQSMGNVLEDESNMQRSAEGESGDGGLSSMVQIRDATIESLRIELVETQIRLAEIEHMGDGRMQELEKAVMETKMTNARLREENESFQHLLSEKTLKGDFLQDSRPTEQSTGLNSLAEELQCVTEDGEVQSDAYRKVEAEAKALRESNKALTLYVDKIIGRLLQHEGFEHIITDKDDPPELPIKPAGPAAVEKALPAPPEQAQHSAATADPAAVSTPGSSFLQKARSAMVRQSTSKGRPADKLVSAVLTANENPETAPSIPLNKGHRRGRSDQAQKDLGAGAAAVVQHMNRGSPLRTVSAGPTSPGIRPLSPRLEPMHGSYFPNAAPSTRTASATGSTNKEQGSGRNSVASELSGGMDSTDATSATTSTHGSGNIPGAVMKQNQLRPLRLVKEQSDEQEQKRANRGSWMGWLKGPALAVQNE